MEREEREAKLKNEHVFVKHLQVLTLEQYTFGVICLIKIMTAGKKDCKFVVLGCTIWPIFL